MIVQLPLICTDRMESIQKELIRQDSNFWFANFDDRPSKLFDGLEDIRATIYIIQKNSKGNKNIYSTKYNRWYAQNRNTLFIIYRSRKVGELYI